MSSVEQPDSEEADLGLCLNAWSLGHGWPVGAVRRLRDLCIFRVGEVSFVLACDSNASIGTKPSDFLHKDPTETGYSAAKVPLMEVVASGAIPFLLADNLCCELEPYGRHILAGINRAVNEVGPGVTITGSDETNMPTVQTGVGVTVLGAAARGRLMVGRARPGDVVACFGLPKDGSAIPYGEGDPEVASVHHVVGVVRSGLANEVLPVGSRGVAYEANELASSSGLRCRFRATSLDLKVSAGASTCFLAAVTVAALASLEALVALPCEIVGELW